MPSSALLVATFVLFALCTLGAVVYILLTRNLVRAAFALFAAFLGQAALYVFAGAEVLAVGQVIVYVGGVLILLLFGVMLTQRSLPSALAQVPTMPRTGLRTVLGGFLAAAAVVAGLLVAFPPRVLSPAATAAVGPSGQAVRQLGVLALTDYLLAFELLSVLLLVALVGAAALARLRSPKPPQP